MATVPAGAEPEVTYIAGVGADGKIAATSYHTWNFDNPVTYHATNSTAFKWGTTTYGTGSGQISYWLNTASNWTAAERAGIVASLEFWEAVANIDFVPTTANPGWDIHISRSTIGVNNSGYGGSGATVGSTTPGAASRPGQIGTELAVTIGDPSQAASFTSGVA